MKKPAEPKADGAERRAKLIGLGERSISKSYYPELKERLEELEHFRALLDRINDAIYVVDAESGVITDVSGAAGALVECREQDMVGREFGDLLPPHIARHLHGLFNSREAVTRLETDLRCPDNPEATSVPVEMTVRVARHGKRDQAVIVARDISDRKRAEEELRKSHEELEVRVRERTRELNRANQAKSEFLSIVSHELRTPLTSVLGFAKIIRKKLQEQIFPQLDADDPKIMREMSQIAENIDIITSEGQRLTELINDVLDLAKLEADGIEFRMKPLDPTDFIQQSARAMRGFFEEAGLRLQVDLEPNLPLVMGDRDRLIQVMVNLLSNAVKFSERGTVRCRAQAFARHVRISVKDPGIGIPRELWEIIFDKFTQAGQGMKDRPKGTGLGLPICRNIVNGHQGHIWVRSTPGKGSEFIFTLPHLRRRQHPPEKDSKGTNP